MKAVVATELNKISIEEVTLDPPKTHEVKIKMAAAGVCHSDLSALNGTIPQPFPLVLGHEGAGVVEEVGEGVTHVQPGDHVVMSFVPNCGRCFHCVRGEAFLCQMPAGGFMLDGTARLKLDGKPLSAFCSLGNMAEHVVCPSINVVKIGKQFPLKVAALVGCGVTTGVGAAINTARVEPGSTVAVFGCGGVGISTIQGARIAGAARIFAVDLSEEKLTLAKEFGATDVVHGEGAAKAIMKATGGIGVDYAFECIGIGAVVDEASKATRRGGTTVVVGVGKLTDTIKVNALAFPLSGKALLGCMFGSANPQHDFPRLLDLYESGKLDLEGMVTRSYTIEEAAQAFSDLEKGVNARGVISFE
ncbi:MAG: Zn-dependent alcohol dehydrogenase [Myxococcales bacterium]|jgi:S-(hydroxymethyl)glutathione dehydrogenase/alcohol dehydrogenase